jgi:hypothetical protein
MLSMSLTSDVKANQAYERKYKIIPRLKVEKSNIGVLFLAQELV